MPVLMPGQRFSSLAVSVVGGVPRTLPDALAGNFGVVLFYRGAGAPYCRAQLRGFQRASDEFAEVGAKVIALSIDDEAITSELIAKLGLSFPVAYGADAAVVAEATGAFIDPEGGFLQSTGFVLDPTGTVLISVYSSGAIGRLVSDDVIAMIRYEKSQTPASD